MEFAFGAEVVRTIDSFRFEPQDLLGRFDEFRIESVFRVVEWKIGRHIGRVEVGTGARPGFGLLVSARFRLFHNVVAGEAAAVEDRRGLAGQQEQDPDGCGELHHAETTNPFFGLFIVF